MVTWEPDTSPGMELVAALRAKVDSRHSLESGCACMPQLTHLTMAGPSEWRVQMGIM